MLLIGPVLISSVRMKGAWDTFLNATFLEDSADAKKGETISTWKREKLNFTGKQFQMTPFAWSLNGSISFFFFLVHLLAFPKDLQQFALPSDSRRRPDRAALALGDVEVATAWKRVAESQQRIEQKVRRGESKDDTWAPVWFKLEKDHEGLPFYQYTQKYWPQRKQQEELKEKGLV